MTKAEIIEAISEEIAVTKKDIGFIIDTFFKNIKKGIADHEHIELRGFGTFGTKKRKSRVARNPKTNEQINVPEHWVPYFKPGKELKEMVGKASKEK